MATTTAAIGATAIGGVIGGAIGYGVGVALSAICANSEGKWIQ
jgi:hypothetical protein